MGAVVRARDQATAEHMAKIVWERELCNCVWTRQVLGSYDGRTHTQDDRPPRHRNRSTKVQKRSGGTGAEGGQASRGKRAVERRRALDTPEHRAYPADEGSTPGVQQMQRHLIHQHLAKKDNCLILCASVSI